MSWTSSTGAVLRDLVPEQLRADWVRAGYCPDRELYALFREQVRAHPERTAVIDDEGSLDYTTLDDQVRGLARRLRVLGYGAAEIIGVREPDSRAAVVAELAVLAVGAVVLPVPPDGEPIAERARASAVITGGAVVELAPGGGAGRTRPDPGGPAKILLSSGSEAEPKLVAYSHNAFAGGRANYLRAVHGTVATPRDLVLVSLSSSFGSFGVPITLCCLGGTLVVTRRFEAGAAVRLIEQHRPTHVFAVPAMWRRIVNHPADHSADHPADAKPYGLVATVSSGDVLPPSTLDACRARFGVEMISVYGSSDGVNCHTTMPELGAGVPDPAVCDIRIEDGEIQARGPMTPLCYVEAPDLDARYRTDGGWVRTGDSGQFDEAGRLHVTGRLKRVVIRGGYTISPAEVELALEGHPSINEVACVPVRDPDLGERLCACITIRNGHTAPRLPDVAEYLMTAGVPKRKLPEFLLCLPDLPLGRTGKVSHRALTRIAAERLAVTS